MTQITYPAYMRPGQPGMPMRQDYKIYPAVDNTRLHQIDQGTLVSAAFNEIYGVNILGVANTVSSSGSVAQDAIALAAVINANEALIGIVEKAEAVADDIFVTYFDYLPHPVMTAIVDGSSDVTPIVISQVANAGQNFAYGVGLVQDTAQGEMHNVKLPAGAFAAHLFAGVNSFENGAPNHGLPGIEATPSGYPVNLFRRGYIWVRINQDVALADPVFIQHTANGNKLPGYFRKDADGGNAQAVNGRWANLGTELGGMAGLELNLV